MAEAVRRLTRIMEAADRLERAAEESAERSWRRCLLRSLSMTARRTARRIEEDPEDEVLPEPAAADERERDDPWARRRMREDAR